MKNNIWLIYNIIMLLLHINSEKDAYIIDKLIKQGKHMFIIVYMVGCGPCNATRPEWHKMGDALNKQYKNDRDLVIADVNKDFMHLIKHVGNIDGFPTMKYIANNGNTVETYENSNIKVKDRGVDSFINWVESKVLDGQVISVTPASTPQHVYNRLKSKKHRKTNKSKTSKRKPSKSKTSKRKTSKSNTK
jgi:hypothetical protein